MQTYEVVVIGGGPAGLQATLSLGRVHRQVLMADSGSYRNDVTDQIHNVVTHDGTPPAQFRAAARKELTAYDTVTVRDEAVTGVEQDGQIFVVRFGDDAVSARGVVLATGVTDSLPDIEGIADLFGSVVAHCPFCHGHEFAGASVAILGALAASHMTGVMYPVADTITVCTQGEELPLPLPDSIAIRSEKVAAVRPTDTGARIEFESGEPVEVGGLFIAPNMQQHAPFAQQLGVRFNPSGCVEVDVMGRTSLPGVHAAGDLAHVAAIPLPMPTVTGAIAAGGTAAGAMVRYLLETSNSPN